MVTSVKDPAALACCCGDDCRGADQKRSLVRELVSDYRRRYGTLIGNRKVPAHALCVLGFFFAFSNGLLCVLTSLYLSVVSCCSGLLLLAFGTCNHDPHHTVLPYLGFPCLRVEVVP